MTINKTQDNEKLTIAIEGKLDAITASEFQKVFIPAFDEAKEIVLDFERLAYISSAGLRVLLTGQKTANTKGVQIKIQNASQEIISVFNMTGFADILTVV
jgi:anti-anti-sigma factor